MSTQIVYTAQCFPGGAQTLSSVSNALAQPSTLTGEGVFRDDDFLSFWGLLATADVTTTPGGGIVQRAITLAMGPSSTATATITLDSGGIITKVTVTGQGLDYIRPPVPVITDATGTGGIVGPCSLQVLSCTQIYAGSSYSAPTVTAVGGLAPGGVPATFSATVGGGGAITGITCTNAASNGPYARAPKLVITDSAGSGAFFRAQMGLHPTIPVINSGTTKYTAPTIAFTPFFKVLNPDADAVAQANAVKGFMLGKLTQAAFMPMFELAPVIS